MFNHPKKQKTENEKLIEKLCAEFTYETRNRASWVLQEPDFNKKNTFLNPNKSENELPGEFELAYMKGEIVNHFHAKMDSLKKSKASPTELLAEVQSLVTKCRDDSIKLRSYNVITHAQGGWQFVHDLEQEYIPSQTFFTPSIRKPGELEKSLTKVEEKIEELKNNYRIKFELK